eukprot:9751682-Ditylum_brightwellii.AAC.1
MLLLKRSDPVHYNDLVEELHRSVTVGRNEYPETTPASYDLLTRRSGTFDSQGQGNRPDRGGRGCDRGGPDKQGSGQDNIRVAFAQKRQWQTVHGTDGQTFDNIICHGRDELGHY